MLSSGIKWFLEAVFPPKCIICKKEGNYLCDKHKKFSPVSNKNDPVNSLENLFAAVAYHDPTVEKVIEFFKFRGFSEIADIMTDEMIKKIHQSFFCDKVFIPIPLHWTRKIWRGFNQAEILTKFLTKKIPNAKINYNLKRTKKTQQQAKLKKNERIKNIQQAFWWDNKNGIPQNIILVDDVASTGATLDTAARILKKNGAQKIYAMVFARGH